MKKILISAILLVASNSTFSQENTLPTTGNIGVGTLNPSARLDVNGNAIIDSSLIIKDSLFVNRSIRTNGKMFIEQKITMKENAQVKQNLRVNGNSKVDGNHRTYGNSTVEGLLKLPNTPALSNNNLTANQFSFLTLKENGTTNKLDYTTFIENVSKSMYAEMAPLSKCDGISVVNNPMWANGPNKIFTTCPQVFVGIGTTTPRVQLDVRGNTGIYGQRLSIGELDPTNSLADFHLHSYYNPQVHPNHLLFLLENHDRRIFSVNNSGLVRAREIKVDLAIWPDYVFKSNYNLMPLNKLESFINKNGHLPNVPSEQEVLENGVELGAMNKVLLEKVEELTLYIIEQQKLIEAQNKRLETLENNQ